MGNNIPSKKMTLNRYPDIKMEVNARTGFYVTQVLIVIQTEQYTADLTVTQLQHIYA